MFRERSSIVLKAASALALAPFTSGARAQEKVGMQLILAADVSGSVNGTRYRTQQDGYLEALGDSRVLQVIGELESLRLPNIEIGQCETNYEF